MYPAAWTAPAETPGEAPQLVGADAVHVFPHPPRLAGRPAPRPGRRAVRPAVRPAGRSGWGVASPTRAGAPAGRAGPTPTPAGGAEG